MLFFQKLKNKLKDFFLIQLFYEICADSPFLARLVHIPYDAALQQRKKEWRAYTRKIKKNEKAQFKILQKLKQKIKNGEKVRVCFSVVLNSSFALELLFQKMQNNPHFEPFILIIPDALRGDERMFYELEKNYKLLKAKYGEQYVKKSFNNTSQTWLDYTPHCDIVAIANPYDGMTLPQYRTEYAVEKGLLPIYTTYSFSMSHYHFILARDGRAIHLMWKIFAENKNSFKNFLNTPNQGRNAVITGYAKMDGLARVELRERERERESKIRANLITV